MEKRVLLGVQKKNNPLKKNKKRILRKVVDYLKSDSFMFSPLISSPHNGFPASRTRSSSTTAMKMKDSNLKEKNKRLIKKVWDYLKSDAYMYAPLCAQAQPVTSLKGHARYIKNVAMEVSPRKISRKDNQSTAETSSLTLEDQFYELAEKSFSGRLHNETVKHMVYQNCRFSLSGKGIHDTDIQRLLVDGSAGKL